MKESITKFDLEAAFRALDELEAPKANRVKANRPALAEIFSKKTKFEALMEEYYDIGNMTELDDAKETREAEVAQAKLARIEKIVDLDAESPEDLLPSYVGKFIMQCPQCMTLFYKDPEDVEASEEDPNTVNVNEVCQHCGNESGYTLIGKVGEATEDEMSDFNQEETVDVTSTDENEDDIEITDEVSDAASEDELDIELDELDLNIEDEEEKTEESFMVSGSETLVEALTEETDLDVSADDFEKLINSPEFKKPISDSEARSMIDELDNTDDKDEINESVVAEATEQDNFLAEDIYDIFHSGKFSHLPAGDIPPKSKKLSDDTYYVTHKSGCGEVTVKFDLDKSCTWNIVFEVKHKRFNNSYVAKTISEAQDFILNDLEVARRYSYDIDLDENIKINGETVKYAVINADGTYAGVPCTSEEEARELANQKDGRVIVELRALTEGVLDTLKNKFTNVVDNLADKLKSREAKANWILANALKDYDTVNVAEDGQPIAEDNNKRFKTFAIIGYTSRDNRGELIKSAPEYNDEKLVIGKNGVQYKDNYAEADKVAKDWSQKLGNGPAFIYLAADENDDNAVFVCEYFMGKLEKDQLENYFKTVKDSLKEAEPATTENTENAEQTNTATESFNAIINNMDSLQEPALEELISSSLVEAYGNVAGFRLTECACLYDQFTIDGTIYFTSGNTRKTTYRFVEAFIPETGKIGLRGLNEKLGIDKQFTITGYTDETKTFITESFKATKK